MPNTDQPTSGVNVSKYGLLQVLNNQQIDTQEQADKAAKAAIEAQSKPEILGLLKHVIDAWERNKALRLENNYDEILLQCLRQRNSEYDPEKLAAIEEMGGTKVFMPLTELKCSAGEAWLRDVLSSDQGKPWKFKPTPVPELPQEVEAGIVEQVMMALQEHIQASGAPPTLQQIHDLSAGMRDEIDEKIETEANIRATKMETLCFDQQVEGNWDKAFSDFITNMVTFPVAFVKGPIIRNQKRLSYDYSGDKAVAKMDIKPGMDFESPSPFDVYQSRGAVDINDGDLVERMRIEPCELERMKGGVHWDSDAIDLVLHEYKTGSYQFQSWPDQERSRLEGKGTNEVQGRNIQLLEYWGGVIGKDLLLEDITKDIHDQDIKPLATYEVNIIVGGNRVLYKALNPDLLGERPYAKSSWKVVPGSYVGKGVPQVMRDIQSICNSDIRALVNNLGVSSGPQLIYNDINRLPSGEDITAVFPFKIHQFTNPGNQLGKPLDFEQPQINAAELMGTYQKFANMADEHTGIPSYAHGNDNVKGAGRTMGGLSMLMSSAARGIKMVIGRVDREVLRNVLGRQFRWNMIYDPDESIKGDIQIVAKGALAQIINEQMTARRMEYLNTTNNPVDLSLTGMEGRRIVLEETSQSLDLGEPAVKSRDEVREDEKQRKQAEEMQAALVAAGGAPPQQQVA